MKVINIVAGGPKRNIPDLTNFDGEDVIWVAVDRGVLHLLEFDITPHYAFGDFDSISDMERESVQQKVKHIDCFPAEKDQTDSEIGMDFALSQKQVKEIYLFGATGGRLDHLFGNVQLLFKALKANVRAKMVDCQNEVTLYKPGRYYIEKNSDYSYVSFIPFSEEVHTLTLDGFKYPLNNCHIERGSTLCISNELIHSVGTFSFTDGILLMIRSSDG